jgi:hypothetical protein
MPAERVNLRDLLRAGEEQVERYRAGLLPHQRAAFDREVAFQRSMVLYGHGISPDGAHHVNAPAGWLVWMHGTTCSHCGQVVP